MRISFLKFPLVLLLIGLIIFAFSSSAVPALGAVAVPGAAQGAQVQVAPGAGSSPNQVSARTFTFVNTMSQTIWVGDLNNPGHPLLNNGGWALAPGQTYTLTVPGDWAGRFWGRTGCTFDSAGNGTCLTGDCGGKLQCAGAGGVPPATLAEFTLTGAGGNDFYDISLVDGYNVPMTVVQVGAAYNPGNFYYCNPTAPGCTADLNASCPAALQKKDASGKVIACMSACEAFNTDQYCCRGAYGTPQTCQPSTWPVNYAAIFKNACPTAYSYAYDDPTSTFQCALVGYKITFGTGSSPSPTNTPTSSGNGTPYGGTAAAVPGTVQAENYNVGGEGVAYHDADTANQGGQYRTDAVDIEATTDSGGGYNVGWTAAGEWMKYTVNVTTSGTYTAAFRVASAQTGGTFHLEVDGVNVTGTMTVPNTGGWQTWTTLTKTGLNLTAGQHILRWVTDAAGGNYNWMSFSTSSNVTPTFAPPTNTPAPGTSNVLYVRSGGALSTASGSGATTVTVASAGGANHDGVVTNPQTFTISGLNGTYNAGNAAFDLFVDSGSAVGNGVQVKVSYDFTGDGTWDRTETYHYFSTNNVANWEDYNQTSFGGLESSTGSYANLANGKVMIQVWSAIGTASSTVRVDASAANGSQSKIVIPFR